MEEIDPKDFYFATNSEGEIYKAVGSTYTYSMQWAEVSVWRYRWLKVCWFMRKVFHIE